jgi:hypothetical protein
LSAEAKGQTERNQLFDIAESILNVAGRDMSRSKVSRLVREYEHQVAGKFTFLDYFTNKIKIDEDRRREILNDPDLRKRISYLDRTGETAVANVYRERGF